MPRNKFDFEFEKIRKPERFARHSEERVERQASKPRFDFVVPETASGHVRRFGERASLEVLERACDGGRRKSDILDFRNQLFELVEDSFPEDFDDEGFLIPAHTQQRIKNEIAFYACYVIMPDRTIHIGGELPELHEGQFFFHIPGMLTKDKVNFTNPKKPGSLLFAVSRKLGVEPNELRLAFFKRIPGFYHSATSRFIPIKLVNGKACGFSDTVLVICGAQ